MEHKKLVTAALAAREKAYTPYAKFQVGAALLGKSGKIYPGCNVECASYSPTNCAERTAFFRAVSEGERAFTAIAIVGGPEGKPVESLCPPCGVCRQVMMEFCDPDIFQIILADSPDHWQVHTLRELLPLGFGPANISGGKEEESHENV
nr:cytidine deaminase [Clostridium sp. D33t1_170424_F3]